MPQVLIYILAALVVVFPIIGAVALRLLRPRLADRPWYFLAIVVCGAVFARAIALGRGARDSVQIGGLAVLQPYQRSADVASGTPDLTGDTSAEMPEHGDHTQAMPEPPEPALPGATASLSDTASFTPTAVFTATPEPPTVTPEPPTATPEPPTATAEPPTATAEPPTATTEPPTATPAPAAERRYTVQPGDTLRSIAEQFNVSVAALLEANNLTPAQADNLRPGQELIIPPAS